MDKELITTPELCEWLKISKATASRWRGVGMPFYGNGRTLRYEKAEVLKWLKEQKEQKE